MPPAAATTGFIRVPPILLMPMLMPLLLLSLTLVPCAQAHNITSILSTHPEFSTFNHYLSLTHLAPDINMRQTITVCAVDNSGMSSLLSKHLPLSSIKNVLSLHVLLDYFGAKKLHQITNGTALAATMFQATGTASGSSGFVNITDLKGGKVAFGPEDNGGVLPATFVKSVHEIPYNISVIQISTTLPNSDAEAPAPSPAQTNLTALMSAHGCKVFADTLLNYTDALSTFQDNVDGGLTVFCPGDDAFKSFLPKFKNLTADGKTSLLLFHGIPVYDSISMLKSGNGVVNTLATDGAKKFEFTVQNDGDAVTLKTKLVTAKITATLLDEQPVAIYSIDKVLLPKELFNATKEGPSPAPAPEPASADSPKSGSSDGPSADSPADGPAEDQTADDTNGAEGILGGGWRFVGLGLSWSGMMMMMMMM